MTDPFVIPVPPGATEIDLRPVLEPVLRAVMFSRWEKHFPTSFVDNFAANWLHETRLARLIETIKWEWLRDYMLNHKWRRADCHTHCQYYPPENYGPTGVCIIMKEEHIPDDHNEVEQNRNAVQHIARWELSKTRADLDDIEQQAQKILDSRAAVDRLASLAGEGQR